MVIIGVVAASVDDISVGVAACDGGGGDCDGVDCDVLVDVGGGGGGGGGGDTRAASAVGCRAAGRRRAMPRDCRPRSAPPAVDAA